LTRNQPYGWPKAGCSFSPKTAKPGLVSVYSFRTAGKTGTSLENVGSE
jgi:hypothetical protein